MPENAKYAQKFINLLEALVAEANAGRNKTLAYFISMAVTEARIQAAAGTLRRPAEPVIVRLLEGR